MRKLLILFALIANPANAAVSFDGLRDLVLDRDFAGVDAALAQAHDEYAKAHQPDNERSLYKVFALTDPAIGQFALDWVNEQPNNPRALTAKGWNLYAWGGILRGDRTAGHTSREAMEGLMSRHSAAFELFDEATKLAPDLIPASDGVLRLTATLGNKARIPLELERIMAIAPNRGSLTRAMRPLAPQWGGRPDQVVLICDRYAEKVPDVKDYTSEVCQIDAVYSGNFWEGEQRAAAHQKLMFMPNPVLDYARHEDLMAGLLSFEDTIAALEKIKAETGLSYKEALMLDSSRMNRTAEINKEVLPETNADLQDFIAALQLALAPSKAAIARDPLNPAVLLENIYIQKELSIYTDQPISDQDKAKTMMQIKQVLRVVPTDPSLWSILAANAIADRGLAGMDSAAIYLYNAIYYSQLDPQYLKEALEAENKFVQLQNNFYKVVDISTLSAAELSRLDRLVHCPMLSQLSVAHYVCDNEGLSDYDCDAGVLNYPAVEQRLRERFAAGACPSLVARDPFQAYSAPMKPDF